jgi:hypothetical protein
MNFSNYKKGFELTVGSNYLIGIYKININNYHLFIPIIYLHHTKERLKLLIYSFNGLLIILLLNETFNPSVKINSLIKLEKWVRRLENLYLQKTSKLDNFSFAYLNGFNKSIKISSTFYNKKNKSSGEG